MCLLAAAMMTASAGAQEITVEKGKDGVAVKVDGQLFTRYVTKSGNKPILWPVIGPNGHEMTRQYPMRKAAPSERADHPHHRSLWFTHGDVNGVSFWHEGDDAGNIVHREFTKIADDPPTIEAINDWVSPDGRKICEELQKFRFGADEDARWIDMELTITAPKSHAVKFGDTKEGSMGIRVAGTMKVDAKGGGRIINSEGQTDKNAWGKAAAWVDYHGPVDGKTVGVAILNHPGSFRFPTYWHVRTYGLFAANPFGLHDFKGDNSIDGSHTLAPGDAFTLRYRIIFHRGDEKQAKIAESFAAYAKSR